MEIVFIGMIMFVLGLAFFASFLMAYTARRHSDQLDKHFQRSKWLLQYLAPLKSIGILGEIGRCGFVAALLLAPEYMSKRGFADIRDLKDFPEQLKVKLLFSYILLHIAGFIMVSLYWFIEAG